MVWVALLLLLACNLGLSFLPTPALDLPVNLFVAACMAVLIGLFFMDLSGADSLRRLLAAIGFAWIGILLLLTFADYSTRPSSARPPDAASPSATEHSDLH